MVFTLISFATITAVFLGLAFGMAVFVSLVMSGFFRIRVLWMYATASVLAFAVVIAPWSLIKDSQAPSDSLDAVSMAVFNTEKSLASFSLERELYEGLLTQSALLNLGGEFPPVSGLQVGNENRIFGTPIFSLDHSCGRFLTAQSPDSLWGPIQTDYTSRCVSPEVMSFISIINSIGQVFYPAVGLALVWSLLLSIRFFTFLRPIILPAFLVTLPYILMDASISRYGALVIPLGAIMLAEIFSPSRRFTNSPI
jgi:hypothetical protein